MEDERQRLTMSEASERLKIPKHTLRFWEKEFEGIFIPPRTKGGQRRYTPGNVAVIEEIKRRREEGMGLSQIKSELNNGNSDKHFNSSKIDLLANRVADVVKAEVYHFFELEKVIK